MLDYRSKTVNKSEIEDRAISHMACRSSLSILWTGHNSGSSLKSYFWASFFWCVSCFYWMLNGFLCASPAVSYCTPTDLLLTSCLPSSDDYPDGLQDPYELPSGLCDEEEVDVCGREGKVLRVLPSDRIVPRNQGWLNFWETELVTVRKSLHRSCWTELTCQGILLPYDRS